VLTFRLLSRCSRSRNQPANLVAASRESAANSFRKNSGVLPRRRCAEGSSFNTQIVWRTPHEPGGAVFQPPRLGGWKAAAPVLGRNARRLSGKSLPHPGRTPRSHSRAFIPVDAFAPRATHHFSSITIQFSSANKLRNDADGSDAALRHRNFAKECRQSLRLSRLHRALATPAALKGTH